MLPCWIDAQRRCTRRALAASGRIERESANFPAAPGLPIDEFSEISKKWQERIRKIFLFCDKGTACIKLTVTSYSILTACALGLTDACKWQNISKILSICLSLCFHQRWTGTIIAALDYCTLQLSFDGHAHF